MQQLSYTRSMSAGLRSWRLAAAVVILLAPATAHAQSAPPVGISEAEAITRFDLRRRFDAYGAANQQPQADLVVEVVNGDLTVTGDLLLDYPRARARMEALVPRRPGDRNGTTLPRAIGLVVTGNLTVGGAIINANINEGPFLLVLGTTRARAMFAGGAELRFEQRATFSDAVVGCYNDGTVHFPAGVDAPLVISEDHSFQMPSRPTLYVDYFNGDGDLAALKSRLHPQIVVPDLEELDAQEQLLPRIRRGERILREPR